MAGKWIQVVFDEEGQPFMFSGDSTLDEMASSLAADNPEDKKRIIFTALLNGQMAAIGNDKMLRAVQDQAPGMLTLSAKYRTSGSKSARSKAPSDTSSNYDFMDIPGAASDVSFQSSRSTMESVRSVLKFKVGYNGAVSEETVLRLKTSLSNMTLFDISTQILEAYELSPSTYACYLYNRYGWPFAANLEQLHLIPADSVLSNEDLVVGLIWQEQMPRAPPYQDPDSGTNSYCFDYQLGTHAIMLVPGCTVTDVRVKLMWKLKIPMELIKVTDSGLASLELQDTYVVKQSDIESKLLKFRVLPLVSRFGRLDDFISVFDGKEMRKIYAYLYLLQKNSSGNMKQALEFVVSSFSHQYEPFLFAFHLLLSKADLTKSERIALYYGCWIMSIEFSQLIAQVEAQDFTLLVGLIYHLASTQTTEYAGKITCTEHAGVNPANLSSSSMMEQNTKLTNLLNLLKYHSQVVSLTVVEIKVLHILQAGGLRTPIQLATLYSWQQEQTFFPILHPRDITNSNTGRLTYHPSGELWVSNGLEDDCHSIGLDQPAILYDVVTGADFRLKKGELATQVEQFIPKDGPRAVISREPEEATVVIFDTSGSMVTKYQKDDTNTRLDAAKIFFLLFAQKTVAYDFPHVFSLCTFAGTASFQFDFTENMDSFLELVQNLRASGNTALYSAMHDGVTKLKAIKVKYPKVALRMMIISDGEDNESTVTAKTVSDLLIQESIVADVFAVGGKCDLVRLISKQSGGYCYFTDTILDGVRTFESETILKLSLRKPATRPFPSIGSDAEFNTKAMTLQFDQDPPEMMRPADIDSKLCSSVRAFELEASAQSGNPLVVKRVLRELNRYSHDPHPDFVLFPLSRNLFLWRGIVEGPQGTPYAGGLFEFYLHFGDGYPGKPPELRFLTPISHPNITRNGKVCHAIFSTAYTAETSVREILNQVYSLLMTQDFDDYVVSNLHITLNFNRDQFRAKALEWTRRFAVRSKTKEQMIKEMMIEDDCPEKYRCPLSNRLMRDPVFSPKSDKIFERSAIELHIQTHGTDPITNVPLTIEELIPDFRLRKEINSLYPS